MKTEYIHECVLLSENLNFTVTARRCFITQSVLSRHIASIEKELKVKLFVRDRNRIRLTRSGELFCAKMKKMLEEYDAIVEETRGIENQANGTLRVAYLAGAFKSLLPDTCRRFRYSNPNINLILYSEEDDSALQGISQNKFDVALTVSYGNINATWHNMHCFYRDSFMLAVGIDHPLAQREVVTIDDIANEKITLLSRNENNEATTTIERAFHARGHNIEFRDTITSFDSFIINFDPDCVAIVPGCFSRAEYQHALKLVPIDSELPSIEVGAIWKASETNNPLIAAFVDTMEHVAEELALAGFFSKKDGVRAFVVNNDLQMND